MESGTSIIPWGYQRNQTAISFKTGAMIDSQFETSRNSQDLLNVLQNANATDIDHAALSYVNWDSTQPGAVGRLAVQQGFAYAPVIEVDNDFAFLTTYQYESLVQGNYNKVPILIGMCAEEGLVSIGQWLDASLPGYDLNPTYLNPQDLHIVDESKWQEVGNLIKNEYSRSSTFTDNPLAAIQYFTEQDFVKSLTKHAEIQSSSTDVYFYEFAYTGTMGGNTYQKWPGSGNVTHVEEYGYIFDGLPLENYPANDQLVHNKIMKIWTNFVIYRNPTPTPEELLENITLPTVQPDNFQYVRIGQFKETDLQILPGKPKQERMDFWEKIYNTYGIRPYDTY